MKKTIDRAIVALSLLGLILMLTVVVIDLAGPGLCPIMLGIPGCYFVFFMTIFVNLSLLNIIKSARWKKVIFLGCAGIGSVIASLASFSKLGGIFQCPELLSIPLCFMMFAILWSLIILKIWSLRST